MVEDQPPSGPDNTDQAAKAEPVEKLLSSLSEDELSRIETLINRVKEDETPDIKQKQGSRRKGIFRLPARLKKFRPDRSFMQDTFVNAFPVILALFTAPFVVQSSFERERELAQPKLSIEYASLTQSSYQLPSELVAELDSIRQQEFYRDYSLSTLSGQVLSTINPAMERLSRSLYQDIVTAIQSYIAYLQEIRLKTESLHESLDDLDMSELRKLSFRYLNTLDMDESQMRYEIDMVLRQRIENISIAEERVQEIKASLSSVDSPILVHLMLLNRGATDGLIRHQGRITYRDKTYEINRSEAPGKSVTMLAVPTYQTNQPSEAFASQSIGKIEKDSMTEFWFEFRPQVEAFDHEKEICGAGEEIGIELFDQNRQSISQTLACQEG